MSFSRPFPRLLEVEEIRPLSSSYLATSPLAQEILIRDIAECSTDSEDEYDVADSDSDVDESRILHGHHEQRHRSASLAFHPSGIAYGTACLAVAPQAPLPAPPVPREVEESRNAERSLLRDNHFLPPKHRRTGDETALRRLYRRIFSTKVRDLPLDDEFVDTHTDLIFAKAVETTPLLEQDYEAGLPTPDSDEEHNRWEAAVAANVIKTTWQREAKTLVQYSAPLIVAFLLHYSVTIGSVLTVGRIGMVELGAVNLATMTASITCYVPVQGLATCLDTLCAQAYGSGHKHLVGLQAQRMTYLLWLLIPPIGCLWWFSEPILASVVPDQETASLAALYLRILIFGIPGVAAFESGKRFVQAQGLFHATTYALLIAAPLSFFMNWFFVWKLGWHFAGAATAMAVTQNLLPLLLVLYVYFIEGSECWKGFSKRAFYNWGPMVRLALPGMIMIEAQFSVLEILTIAAGQFGTANLAAQSVLVTTTSTAFNIPFPLAIAASTRVANLIGARLVGAARTSAKVALAAGCIVGLFNLTILSTFRHKIPLIFTSDLTVATIVAQAMTVCAVLQIFDALAAVSHGLLRGLGRQSVGGYANLFSYYFVALPVSLGTGFWMGWKLAGLWFGLTAGLAVVTAIELVYLFRIDWETAVDQAEARMRSDANCEGEAK
ncbi:MATE efflux family protein [Coniochaeta sp. PMI_546]|nr:MATE efflux family protein [Coniochaeta sp. PMI_546]